MNVIEGNMQMYEETKDPYYLEQANSFRSRLEERLMQEKQLIENLNDKPNKSLKPIQEIFKEGLLDDTTPQFKARQKIINMPIENFLRLAKPLNEEHSSRAREALQKGIRWSDLPFLEFDTFDDETEKVYGHEGRHRARVLKELGYTDMPVELRSRDIRWSEQLDPDSHDYVKNFPKYLMEEGEGRLGKIPFPLTREEAPLPAKSLEQAYKEAIEKNAKPSTLSKVVDVAGDIGKGLGKLGSRIVPGLGQVLTAMDMYNFFANPMVADAPTIERPKPRPEMFFEPDAIQKDKLYNSYLNSRNRMG